MQEHVAGHHQGSIQRVVWPAMPEERTPYAGFRDQSPAASTLNAHVASTNCSSSVKRKDSICTASVGQRAAHNPQRMQAVGSSNIADAGADAWTPAAALWSMTAATVSLPSSSDTGTSFRQLVGHTSTQP